MELWLDEEGGDTILGGEEEVMGRMWI